VPGFCVLDDRRSSPIDANGPEEPNRFRFRLLKNAFGCIFGLFPSSGSQHHWASAPTTGTTMSATRDLLIGTASSLLAALIMGVLGIVGVKFALPSLHLNVPLIELPPEFPPLLSIIKRVIGRTLVFAVLVALGMTAVDIEIELPHLLQTASAGSSAISSSQPAYSPDFYFSKASSALTRADIAANLRSLVTQGKISSLLQNEEIQSHFASRDQEGQIKNTTQEQIKELLNREAAQSSSELSEARKEAEFWRSKATTTAQAAQPVPPAPPKQSWYESAVNGVSEQIIWGLLLFGYLTYVFQLNRKARLSVQSGTAAALLVVVMCVMSIAGLSSTALLTIEALLLATVLYAGNSRKLSVAEILINAPYLVYQRLFLAVALIAVAALVSWGLLGAAAGVGMTSVMKHLLSNDDSVAEGWAIALPYLGIPFALVLNFVIDFFVAFAGAMYLTSLVYVDDAALPPKLELDPPPKSSAAKAT
jgi:hypothetical protein